MAKVQMSPQKSQPWRDTSNSLFIDPASQGPTCTVGAQYCSGHPQKQSWFSSRKGEPSEGRTPPSLPDSGSFSIAGSFPRPRSGQGQAKVSSALHRAARSLPGTVFLELEFIDKFLPFIRHLTFKWLQVHRKLQTEVHRE